MIEAKIQKTERRYFPFILWGALLATPMAFVIDSAFFGFSTEMARLLIYKNLFLTVILVGFLAARASSTAEKYLRLIHLALLPWLIASLGVGMGALDSLARGYVLTSIQDNIALNFCLSLSLFFLFAILQVRERCRIKLRDWIAPVVLFFMLGILQFMYGRESPSLLPVMSGVSLSVVCLNAVISWQISSAWEKKSRILFLSAIALMLVGHISILFSSGIGGDNFLLRNGYEALVLALLFAFHLKVSFTAQAKQARAPSRKLDTQPMLLEEVIRPLHAVIAYSEVLKSELASSLQLRASRDAEKINQAALQMLSLIEHKPPRQCSDCESFDAERLMTVLQHLAEKLAQPYGTQTKVFCPHGFGVINGDEVKLLQICAATLDYIFRSHRPSKVSIHLYPLRKEGKDFINIDIREVGAGVSRRISDVLEAGFSGQLNLYVPMKSPLGLLRIRDLCESIGASFWLESCEGMGSTFSIMVPDGVSRSQRTIRKVDKHSSILLIDEDNRTERMLKDFARGRLDLVRVKQVRSGLRVFYEKQPEIVIADLTSPGLDSQRFIENVRAQNATCFIVALVRTGHLGFNEQSEQKGADLSLEKPCSVGLLMKGLGSLNPLLFRRSA